MDNALLRAPAGAPMQGDVAARDGRDVSLDAVRLLGVVAVVAGHTWPTGWVRDVTFPWHVPVFFVLAGFLWQVRPWHRELSSRASRLLRPYLFWLAVLGVVVIALKSAELGAGAALGALVLAMVYGGVQLVGSFNAFWFVSCLFFSCLIYAAADRAGWAWRWAVVALAAVLTVAGSEQLALLPLSAGTALPAVVFIEAGRQLRRLSGRLDHPAVVALATLVVALMVAAVAVGRMPAVDMKVGDFGVPVLGVLLGVVLSAALVVLARRALRGVGRRTAWALTTAGPALVPVVLLHSLVLKVPTTDWGWEMAQFAISVVVPLAIALGLGRTWLSGWALGRSAATRDRSQSR